MSWEKAKNQPFEAREFKPSTSDAGVNFVLHDGADLLKNAKYLLLDNISKGLKGGSGNKFDWNNLKNIGNKKNIILSGGLNQENILDAIYKTGIEFYDFCSSTEIKPGIKNIKKIESIVNLINNAKK